MAYGAEHSSFVPLPIQPHAASDERDQPQVSRATGMNSKGRAEGCPSAQSPMAEPARKISARTAKKREADK